MYDVRCIMYVCILVLILNSCGDKHVKEDQLPYYSSAEFTSQWLARTDADTVHQIPDFSFTNQYGQMITRQTFDKKITVVDFFFTTCPGICKKLTSSLSRVQDEFKNDDRVLLLSHSVTPEKDSVPVLKRYAEEHNAIKDKWHFVTGDKNFIYRIARTAYFADEDMGWKQDSSVFLHTENILLIDGDHHIRGVYKGTVDLQVNDLIADIKKLKSE